MDVSTELTFNDAVRLARGCRDYGGGYREEETMDAYRAGIDTVVAVLAHAEKNGIGDHQSVILHRIGEES